MRWGSAAALGLTVLVLLCVTSTGYAESREEIPVAALFADPLVSHVSISRDGEHIAGRAVYENHEFVVVSPSNELKLRPLLRLDEEGVWLNRLIWADDDLVVGSGMTRFDEWYVKKVAPWRSRLFSVHRDGSDLKLLGSGWGAAKYRQIEDRFVDRLWDDPGHILLLLFDGQISVRRLNVETGKLRDKVARNDEVTAWWSDPDGRVRAGVGAPQGKYKLFARVKEGSRVQQVHHHDMRDEWGAQFAGFSFDPKILYVRSERPNQPDALSEFDLTTKKVGKEVFSNPVADPGSLWYSRRKKSLVAIEYTVHERNYHFLDEHVQSEYEAISKALGGTRPLFLDQSHDETRALYRVDADTRPPETYVFDRRTKRLDLLFKHYPLLEERLLVKSRPVELKAKDGLAVPAYLALPTGDPGTNLPVIVIPSGLQRRASLRFDPLVQLLANRGFAVLRINHRGAWGYGVDYMRKARGELGRGIQLDIQAGVDWLVEKGVADPKRIGIYGVGFGGYTALMAAAAEGTRISAAASWCAVTDLPRLIEQMRQYDQGWDYAHQYLGLDFSLRNSAPLQQAGEIRIPVLLGQARDDPFVHFSHGERMEKALEKQDSDVELIMYEGERSEFLHADNRIDFHERMVAFFQEKLGEGAAGQ